MMKQMTLRDLLGEPVLLYGLMDDAYPGTEQTMMKERAMINKEIKPCPFCGSAASVGIRNGFYKVICNNPECSTRYNGWLSKDRAVKEWNTRRKGKKND